MEELSALLGVGVAGGDVPRAAGADPVGLGEVVDLLKGLTMSSTE